MRGCLYLNFILDMLLKTEIGSIESIAYGVVCYVQILQF